MLPQRANAVCIAVMKLVSGERTMRPQMDGEVAGDQRGTKKAVQQYAFSRAPVRTRGDADTGRGVEQLGFV
jgi:hypothetical protein